MSTIQSEFKDLVDLRFKISSTFSIKKTFSDQSRKQRTLNTLVVLNSSGLLIGLHDEGFAALKCVTLTKDVIAPKVAITNGASQYERLIALKEEQLLLACTSTEAHIFNVASIINSCRNGKSVPPLQVTNFGMETTESIEDFSLRPGIPEIKEDILLVRTSKPRVLVVKITQAPLECVAKSQNFDAPIGAIAWSPKGKQMAIAFGLQRIDKFDADFNLKGTVSLEMIATIVAKEFGAKSHCVSCLQWLDTFTFLIQVSAESGNPHMFVLNVKNQFSLTDLGDPLASQNDVLGLRSPFLWSFHIDQWNMIFAMNSASQELAVFSKGDPEKVFYDTALCDEVYRVSLPDNNFPIGVAMATCISKEISFEGSYSQPQAGPFLVIHDQAGLCHVFVAASDPNANRPSILVTKNATTGQSVPATSESGGSTVKQPIAPPPTVSVPPMAKTAPVVGLPNVATVPPVVTPSPKNVVSPSSNEVKPCIPEDAKQELLALALQLASRELSQMLQATADPFGDLIPSMQRLSLVADRANADFSGLLSTCNESLKQNQKLVRTFKSKQQNLVDKIVNLENVVGDDAGTGVPINDKSILDHYDLIDRLESKCNPAANLLIGRFRDLIGVMDKLHENSSPADEKLSGRSLAQLAVMLLADECLEVLRRIKNLAHAKSKQNTAGHFDGGDDDDYPILKFGFKSPPHGYKTKHVNAELFEEDLDAIRALWKSQAPESFVHQIVEAKPSVAEPVDSSVIEEAIAMLVQKHAQAQSMSKTVQSKVQSVIAPPPIANVVLAHTTSSPVEIPSTLSNDNLDKLLSSRPILKAKVVSPKKPEHNNTSSVSTPVGVMQPSTPVPSRMAPPSFSTPVTHTDSKATDQKSIRSLLDQTAKLTDIPVLQWGQTLTDVKQPPDTTNSQPPSAKSIFAKPSFATPAVSQTVKTSEESSPLPNIGKLTASVSQSERTKILDSTTTTTSIFGKPPAAISLAGATPNDTKASNATTNSIFVKPTPSGVSSVFAGQSKTPQATTTSIFGEPSSSQSIFGSNQAKTSSEPSTNSIFGKPSPATTSTSSIFGSQTVVSKPAEATVNSIFGKPSPNSSIFGSHTKPAEETTNSIFGKQSSPATNSSIFGGQTGVSSPPANSIFGGGGDSTKPANSGGQTSIFASKSPTGSSIFGGKPAETSNSIFGGGGGSFTNQNQTNSIFGKPANLGASSSIFSGTSGNTSGVNQDGVGSIFGNNSGGFGGLSFGGSGPGDSSGKKNSFFNQLQNNNNISNQPHSSSQTTTSPMGGSIFGASKLGNVAASTGGSSIFGSPPAMPQSGGSIFGSSAGNLGGGGGGFGSKASFGGSAFGSSAASPPQALASGSVFGSGATSVFGASSGLANSPPAGSIFAAALQNSQK